MSIAMIHFPIRTIYFKAILQKVARHSFATRQYQNGSSGEKIRKAMDINGRPQQSFIWIVSN